MAQVGKQDGALSAAASDHASKHRISERLLLRSYLAAWHIASLGVLSLFPAWKFGVPVWRLPQRLFLPCAALGAAYVVAAGVAAMLRTSSGWRGQILTSLTTMAAYGLVFLGLVVTKSEFSRFVSLSVFASANVLILAPQLLPASWPLRGLALAALLATPAGYRGAPEFASRIAESMTPAHTSALLKSSYYNLRVDTYRGPGSAVHGGALARIGDRYLLMTGEGHLYLFSMDARSQGPGFTLLPYRVPLNGKAFAAAAGRPWATRPGEAAGLNENGASEALNPEYFRAYGLLVQEIGKDARIFVSYDYWHAERRCFVERVSVLEGDRASIIRGVSGLKWRMLYETSPCLPVRGKRRRHGIPFVGYFGGGRMQLLDSQTILLTVGDFGFDGVASVEALAQDRSASYGKTIAINIADGRAKMFTMGHRNPEGLFIDEAGNIWSTEHGPEGGDKLDRLIRGGNYGWPYATYGTDYGSFTWPLNKPESQWGDYQDPVFAWVPSIAVSNLLVVEKKMFPRWRGDLLIGSLKARTLFRARLKNGHVVYIESIYIGSRIRDLIEGHDGRILLWTDNSTLISLTRDKGTSGEALFAEKCSGCHQSSTRNGNHIGPDLAGVFGRRIASLKGYPDYSPALRHLQGRWTEKRLDIFLKDPTAACPGTNMDMSGVASEKERAAIINYLKTL